MCTFLNLDLLSNIEFSSFEIEKGTWVDSELSEHYADILYSSSLKSESGKIYFLFEHKSTIDYKISRRSFGIRIRYGMGWRNKVL